jgi:hypothetical protein
MERIMKVLGKNELSEQCKELAQKIETPPRNTSE